MNLCFRLFLFVVLTVALLSRFDAVLAQGEEVNVVDADPFQHQISAADEQQQFQRALSVPAQQDHVILKASAQGDLDTVVNMIRHDPDLLHFVNEMGWTPLTFAVANGHVALARRLLELDANPDYAERDGWSPLMFAAYHGDEEMINVLLQFGANLLAKSNRDITAHELARLQNHENLAYYLGTQSVFAALRQRNMWEVLHHLRQGGFTPNLQNDAGWTPLIVAVDMGDIEGARILLEDMGAQVDLAENDGWTPLLFAAFQGRAELVDFLLQHGADLQHEAKNRESVRTAYEMAAQGGHEEVLRVLRHYYTHLQIPVPGAEAVGAASQSVEEQTQQDVAHAQEEQTQHVETKHHAADSAASNSAAASSTGGKEKENKKKRGGTGFFNW